MPTGRTLRHFARCLRLLPALLLWPALWPATPAARAGQLPVKTYTVADGLAHDRVNRVTRDSRGFL